jgi:PII-like signaling protein
MPEWQEMTLMRIFVSENDRFEKRPLFEAVVELLLKEGFSGATVLKGAMGFGCRSVMHTDRILRLSQDLPVVVEVVEEQAKIDAILPRIEGMFQGGLITLEKARVIRFGEKRSDDQSN